MSDPWYRDGLKFTCTQCGDCCTGAPGNVWVDDADVAAIAGHLGVPVAELRAMYTKKGSRGLTLREKANGDCVFWERGTGCTVYEARPPQCRTWPFWESNVKDRAAWDQTCEVCPGSGRGELISAEEITRRLQVIRL